MTFESLKAARGHLPSLTALRFFAALAVIIQHYTFKEELFPAQLFLGYEAVTFFFVLSGFILTYAHAPDVPGARLKTSAGQFLIARAARILPVYYFALLVALPWYLYYLATHVVTPGEFTIGAFLVIVLLQSWFPHFTLYWNAPAWSLSVEALFYLAYPLLWQWTRGFSDRSVLAFAAILVVLVGVIRQLFLDGPSDDINATQFALYFPLLHLPQFVLGLALGRLFVYHAELSRKYTLAILVVAILGLILSVLFRDAVSFLQNTAVVAFICGALILGFARPPTIIGWKPLSGRVLSLLGETSYGMYVLHYPLLLWYRQALRMTDLGLPYWLDFVIYIGLVIVVAVLSFYLIETPVRRWVGAQRARPSAVC